MKAQISSCRAQDAVDAVARVTKDALDSPGAQAFEQEIGDRLSHEMPWAFVVRGSSAAKIMPVTRYGTFVAPSVRLNGRFAMNYRKQILAMGMTTVAALWGVCGYGQNAGGGQDFVTNAAVAGQTEVAAARIALKNSQADDVKTFARQMIADHSKANDELTSIAKGKKLTVPAHVDAKHRAVLASLRTQKGSAFDAAYSKQMVADHQEAVALFKSEAADNTDSDLSAFAKKTLPTLEHHKSMADALASQHPAQ